MKTRDLVNLLNAAAAALETPKDLTEDDKRALIEDLLSAAVALAALEQLSGGK